MLVWSAHKLSCGCHANIVKKNNVLVSVSVKQ